MGKLIMGIFSLICIAIIAGVSFWYIKNDDQTAVISSPTPEIVSTPLPTSTPTATSVVSASPSNSRVDYVRAQLIASGIEVSSFNGVVGDKRLILYPVKIVAYKQPDWKIIEDKLYSPTSLQKGINYIHANQAVFDQVEKDYGVEKEVLAGLIAIETDFGQNAGVYPVFSILYSRMMRWPATTWKAQADQLVAFSTYCIRSKIDCFSVKGSYAGAFGIVQFMPNSLLAYGIDGDGNGVINLSSPIDAIPSAANFLKQHGWDQDHLRSLARYYGSSEGYPGIVLTYASLLTK